MSHRPNGHRDAHRTRRAYRSPLGLLLVAAVTVLNFSVVAVPWAPRTAASVGTTFPAGSLVIDLGKLSAGETQQTLTQALRPYGLLFQLLITYKIPVSWAIADDKVAGGTPPATGKTDQVDFTLPAVYANGVGAAYPVGSGTGSPVSKTYKSSAFIVSWDDLKAESPAVINTLLTTWRGGTNQVTVDVAAAPITVPVFTRLTWWPKATLDFQNGKLAIPYYENAGIPETQDVAVPATAPDFLTYSYKQPSELTGCDDIFIMPHADPTWNSHENLIAFNNGGGAIWAGCKAASVMENLDDPADADTDPDMNFLTTNGMVADNQHDNGSPPYAYTTDGSDPVMQFLGILDNATTNGAEQIYMPALDSAWRPTTNVLVWDPTQKDVPSKSAGPAAVVAYGRGFGVASNGLVMYEAGHSLNDNNYGGAAERAFFNFQLLTSVEDTMHLSLNVPSSMVSGVASPVSATITSGSAPYNYTWSTTGNGTFATASGTSTDGVVETTYTPGDTESGNYNIKLTVTDACGRLVFDSKLTHVEVKSDASITKVDSPDPVIAGSELTYTITVQNATTPGAPATGVVVTDTLPAGTTLVSAQWKGTPPAGSTCTVDGNSFTCPYGAALAPGASASIEVKANVATDAVSPLVNTATVSSTNDFNSANNQATASTTVYHPKLSLTKSAVPHFKTPPAVGDLIDYTLVATNSGDMTLHGVSISDSLLSDLTCVPAQPATLAAGAAMTCTGSRVLTQQDIENGKVENTATADSDETPAVQASADVPITQVAALSLTKAASPSTYDAVDEVVGYSYVVANSGNVRLSGPFTVADDKAADEACPPTPSSLAPGESVTCTASYKITQADLDAGSVTNKATATNGTVTSNEATATVTAVAKPALSLSKSASPTTYNAVDQVIGYSFVVKNTGNVTLSGPFTVADDKAADEACPATPSSLAPGESVTCTASYKVTQADLDAGSVTNKATATNGTVTSNEATATVTATQGPALSLKKTASPLTYDAVDETISYSYELKNSGNVTLASPFEVVDDHATVTCPSATTLAVGATLTCSATYSIGQADLDLGSVINKATATATFNGNPVTSNEATATVTAVQTASLSLTKAASPMTYDAVDQVIGYSFVVKNTGNVTLAGPFTVADDKATDESCPSGSLAPGASVTCIASYKITQADLDAGSVTNEATASTSYAGNPVTSNEATATVTAVAKPALSLSKSASPTTYDAVDQVTGYSFVVKNTGNVTLAGPFTVADDKATDESCPSGPLAPSATITCTASYNITQADLDAGSVTNKATASTSYAGKDVTSNEATATVTAVAKPALSIDKTALETSYAKPGDVIHYSYLVTNSGNVTLTDAITVTDNKAMATCPALPTGGLAPGASITCSASYSATQADIDAGSVTNVAYATSGTTQSPTDTVTVPATQAPALTLGKVGVLDMTVVAPSDRADVGDKVNYTLTATNTGNQTLTNVTISDPLLGTLGCTPAQPATLAPGAKLVCTGSYTLTLADINAGKVNNTATADSDQTPPTDTPNEVPVPKAPALSIDKTATESTYAKAGDVIHYSYKVTNSGNVTLMQAISVTDTKVTVTCPALPAGGLVPNGFITCMASYTVTQADMDAGSVTNVAYATSGTTQSPTDTVTVPGTQSPKLTLEKTPSPTTYSTVGQSIAYSYKVTNSGNVTLAQAISVTDTKVTVTCPALPAGGLVPNAFITCTAAYTITQADLDAGSVVNKATASTSYGGKTVTSNEATATVTAVQSPALTLAKTANPTTYKNVGDVIAYSYKVTNSGNVTLTNAISVTDDKATVTCPALPAGGLVPGAFITCTASYMIQAGDLRADYAGTVTNSATASTTFGGNAVTSNLATATVRQLSPLHGATYPTQTTCEMYKSGTAVPLTQLGYAVRGSTINSVSPGVVFYYTEITGTGSPMTITVTQSNTGGWKPMAVQQVMLWSSTCSKVATGTSSGDVATVTANTTAGAKYYLAVKYSPSSLAGQSVTKVGGKLPTVTYAYVARIGVSDVPNSDASIIVTPRK